jgi:hypothetical protein
MSTKVQPNQDLLKALRQFSTGETFEKDTHLSDCVHLIKAAHPNRNEGNTKEVAATMEAYYQEWQDANPLPEDANKEVKAARRRKMVIEFHSPMKTVQRNCKNEFGYTFKGRNNEPGLYVKFVEKVEETVAKTPAEKLQAALVSSKLDAIAALAVFKEHYGIDVSLNI